MKQAKFDHEVVKKLIQEAPPELWQTKDRTKQAELNSILYNHFKATDPGDKVLIRKAKEKVLPVLLANVTPEQATTTEPQEWDDYFDSLKQSKREPRTFTIESDIYKALGSKAKELKISRSELLNAILRKALL